jgi:hypothetical protein
MEGRNGKRKDEMKQRLKKRVAAGSKKIKEGR